MNNAFIQLLKCCTLHLPLDDQRINPCMIYMHLISRGETQQPILQGTLLLIKLMQAANYYLNLAY